MVHSSDGAAPQPITERAEAALEEPTKEEARMKSREVA
jgi:hypothetical protein